MGPAAGSTLCSAEDVLGSQHLYQLPRPPLTPAPAVQCLWLQRVSTHMLTYLHTDTQVLIILKRKSYKKKIWMCLHGHLSAFCTQIGPSGYLSRHGPALTVVMHCPHHTHGELPSHGFFLLKITSTILGCLLFFINSRISLPVSRNLLTSLRNCLTPPG